MHVLLISGLGPSVKYESLYNESFLAFSPTPGVESSPAEVLRAADLSFARDGRNTNLLRPRRDAVANLSSASLISILQKLDLDVTAIPLGELWASNATMLPGSVDVVALSTTFICNTRHLRHAISWIEQRFPDALLILGGQYSNLKFRHVLSTEPFVDFIVRGDGEEALPILLDALRGRKEISETPNLVSRSLNGTDLAETAFRYIDLETEPSPLFIGQQKVVPYESMRGCPFRCGFCSFPAASPKWRYKSAKKIASDFQRYHERNGAQHVRSMDSTFTVPKSRFYEVMGLLESSPVTWEAYARANAVENQSVVDKLVHSRCRTLSIGFEAMSDASLKRMNKGVTSGQNRRAAALLSETQIEVRGSFMVGYPGETPEEYEQTHRFLIEEFPHRFMLSVFSLIDETMPVWSRAEEYGLAVEKPDDPDAAWQHGGMDSRTATDLFLRTVKEARWSDGPSVMLLWQSQFELPLAPHLSKRVNYRIEKLVERLAMARVDFAGEPRRVANEEWKAVQELTAHGILVGRGRGG